MAWVTKAHLDNLVGANTLIGMSDDDQDPATADSAIIAQAILGAECVVKGALRPRYPAEIDAETESATITHYAAILTLGVLGLRRFGPSNTWHVDAVDARQFLRSVADGDSDIPEWEAANPTGAICATGKYEFQAPEDLFDAGEEAVLIPNEHAADER